METISAEALPEFDPEWFPTLWGAYLAFGPSLENPHGHGGFLSPRNGACMTSGPMADVDQGNAPSELGRKRAREQANSKSALATPSSNTPSDTHSVAVDGSDVTA